MITTDIQCLYCREVFEDITIHKSVDLMKKHVAKTHPDKEKI